MAEPIKRQWSNSVEFLRDISEALKLNRGIKSFVMSVSMDQFPTAHVEFFIKDVDQQRDIAKVLEKYNLGTDSVVNEVPKEWTE